MTTPPTEQQLDEIETRHAAASKGPWRRSEDYSDVLAPDGSQLASYWMSADGEFIAHAPEDVRTLLDEVRRLTAALTEMTHCRDNALRALYRDDVETDIDLEETIAAPFYGPGWDWDESDLKPVVREAADAVRPAFGKLTEERDQLRAESERVRRIANRLAAHAAGFGDVLDESDRGPWGRTVGADIAELSAAVAPDAASEVTSAPLSPSQPPGVSESAQSPTRTPEGAPRDSGAEQRDRRERYATAIHDAMEPDLSLVDQEPACQALFARAAEAAVALADTEAVEDLASADNPTHLRWGLNDVLWGDDDSVIVLLSGPDREPYWLELDPERAAVLREDLAGPDEEQQATARCGHDIETALGTYPCERDTDHDGDCDERTEAEYAAEGSGH